MTHHPKQKRRAARAIARLNRIDRPAARAWVAAALAATPGQAPARQLANDLDALVRAERKPAGLFQGLRRADRRRRATPDRRARR